MKWSSREEKERRREEICVSRGLVAVGVWEDIWDLGRAGLGWARLGSFFRRTRIRDSELVLLLGSNRQPKDPSIYLFPLFQRLSIATPKILRWVLFMVDFLIGVPHTRSVRSLDRQGAHSPLPLLLPLRLILPLSRLPTRASQINPADRLEKELDIRYAGPDEEVSMMMMQDSRERCSGFRCFWSLA